MDALIPWGTAKPFRLVDDAEGYRLFCISNALWPALSGCLSDKLLEFTPEAEEALTREVLTLSSSICLEEILGKLDAILVAIKGLNVCCAMSVGSPGVDEPPADIERGVGNPPIGETWEEYDVILCQSLQKAVDLCDESIDALTDALGALGMVGLDMLALYLAPVATPVSLLLVLLGALTAILEEELYDQWAGELGLYAEDLICAAFLSYSPATAKTAIDAVIEEYVTPAPNILLHKILWSQTLVNRIFSGEIEGYAEYDPEYCDTCESIPLDEWHFDGSLEGWYLQQGAFESELTYNPNYTHTEDGTGCAQLYLDEHWFGQWWSDAQVNTNVLVVENMVLEWYASRDGDIRKMRYKVIFDDETEWGDEWFGFPSQYPNWSLHDFAVPGAHIGKHIVGIRLGWQGNDDFAYFDDVRLFTTA